MTFIFAFWWQISCAMGKSIPSNEKRGWFGLVIKKHKKGN
jgi:hypothetical protein